MGSQSDYKIMKLCEKTLKNLGVLFETKIISAHRTPKRMYEYASNAEKNSIGYIEDNLSEHYYLHAEVTGSIPVTPSIFSMNSYIAGA